MRLDTLQHHLDELLEVTRLRDYCPNGLQVEGRGELGRILCGVTASQALINAAIDGKYDAILVHHGYFWRGEDGRIVGIRRQRLGTLLGANISLLAYHLPLDAHPILGNNAQLARLLGWEGQGHFGDQDLGWIGTPATPGERALTIANAIAQHLARPPFLVGDGEREVSKVAWCTGGAQGMFEQAIAAGADLYVSGEISEPTTHLARESGIPYIAAGHHATERYGIAALAKHISDNLGLQADFVDLDNPV